MLSEPVIQGLVSPAWIVKHQDWEDQARADRWIALRYRHGDEPRIAHHLAGSTESTTSCVASFRASPTRRRREHRYGPIRNARAPATPSGRRAGMNQRRDGRLLNVAASVSFIFVQPSEE